MDLMLGTMIALGLSIVAAIVLYLGLRQVWPLVCNGLLGIGVFWVLSYLGMISVRIDIWTVLISAIGGIFGVMIVVILTYLGIAV